MRRILKWLAIVFGGLVAILLIALVALFFIGSRRVSRTYTISPHPIEIPSDAAALERGQHLVTAFGDCKNCHGANLGGQVFFDQPPIGTIYAPNLTSGQGGIGASFTTEDWERAIQHGVGGDSHPLLVMPAQDYYYMSDQDLGDMIAYLKSVPPVDNRVPKPSYSPIGKILIAAGVFGKDVFPAEVIAHNAPRPAAPAPGVSVEYGEYLSRIGGCHSCHGENLTGAQPGDPESPPATNLTQSGELRGWTEADFISALRTGTTPAGHQLDPQFMPWDTFSNTTDEELQALWLYLHGLKGK